MWRVTTIPQESYDTIEGHDNIDEGSGEQMRIDNDDNFDFMSVRVYSHIRGLKFM